MTKYSLKVVKGSLLILNEKVNDKKREKNSISAKAYVQCLGVCNQIGFTRKLDRPTRKTGPRTDSIFWESIRFPVPSKNQPEPILESILR